MTLNYKIYPIAALGAFSVSVIQSTFFGSTIPEILLYVSILALFGVGLFQATRRPDSYPLFTLILASFLPLLLAIGPTEPGLYGYDPYAIVGFAEDFQRGMSISQFTGEFGTRPLIYALVTTLTAILDAGIVSVGKYLPLINILAPLTAYLIFRGLVSKYVGLLTGFSLAAMRTMFIFQSKFVLQALAFPLFLVLVFVLVLNRRKHINQINICLIIILLGGAVASAHKVTSVMTVFLLGIWLGVTLLSNEIPYLERRQTSGLLTATVVTGTVVFLIFTQWDTLGLQSLLLSILGVSEYVPSPSTGGSLSILNLVVIYGNLLILLVFCIINIGTLHPKKLQDWSLSFLIFNGLLMGLYGIQSVIGNLTGLHATRLPLFAVPFLIGVAVYVLWDADMQHPSGWHALVVGLVLLFIVGQVFSVPFHVLAADGSQPVAESHFHENSRQAVHWAGAYSEMTIVGFERDLWWYYGGLEFRLAGIEPCSGGELLVERNAPSIDNGTTAGPVYDNGFIKLEYCT